jgi:hypothetical protein
MVAQRTDFRDFSLLCDARATKFVRHVKCVVFSHSLQEIRTTRKRLEIRVFRARRQKGAFSRALVGFEPTFPD